MDGARAPRLAEGLSKTSQMVVDGRLVFSCGCRLTASIVNTIHRHTERLLTAVRMHCKRAFADSAHALVDITSFVADQHASMDANCGMHGLIAAATRSVKDCTTRLAC